ncbi:MAG: phosphatase PAP2 family protein [Pseudomonadales bacterium]|nr:phosphatase PAP2 family protein [Pseudomonadales bacterium]
MKVRLFKLCCLLLTPFSLPLYASSKTETGGDLLRLAIPATALAATLWVENNAQQHYQGTWQLANTIVTTTAVTVLLKHTVDKERPNGECCEAFPSGHSAIAFSGASFIHRRYGIGYGLAAYGAASWVAYSRVYADEHAWEDVAAGAAIGILSSLYFTSAYLDDNKVITISPIISRQVLGLKLSARW